MKEKRLGCIKWITFRQISPLIPPSIKPSMIPSISDTLKSILKKLISRVTYSYLLKRSTKTCKWPRYYTSLSISRNSTIKKNKPQNYWNPNYPPSKLLPSKWQWISKIIPALILLQPQLNTKSSFPIMILKKTSI